MASELPPELVAYLFSHLPLRDVVACGAVCRQWRAVAGEWSLFRKQPFHPVTMWSEIVNLPANPFVWRWFLNAREQVPVELYGKKKHAHERAYLEYFIADHQAVDTVSEDQLGDISMYFADETSDCHPGHPSYTLMVLLLRAWFVEALQLYDWDNTLETLLESVSERCSLRSWLLPTLEQREDPRPRLVLPEYAEFKRGNMDHDDPDNDAGFVDTADVLPRLFGAARLEQINAVAGMLRWPDPGPGNFYHDDYKCCQVLEAFKASDVFKASFADPELAKAFLEQHFAPTAHWRTLFSFFRNAGFIASNVAMTRGIPTDAMSEIRRLWSQSCIDYCMQHSCAESQAFVYWWRTVDVDGWPWHDHFIHRDITARQLIAVITGADGWRTLPNTVADADVLPESVVSLESAPDDPYPLFPGPTDVPAPGAHKAMVARMEAFYGATMDTIWYMERLARLASKVPELFNVPADWQRPPSPVAEEPEQAPMEV